MATNADKKKLEELWVGWTRDAGSAYVMPDESDNNDELIDDMIEVTTGYADGMLDEYEKRFSGGRGRRRKKKPVEDDPEDEEEEEEDP